MPATKSKKPSPTLKKVSVGKSEKTDYREKFASMGDGKVGRHLYHLIKSRYKIIYVRSHEEMRVMQCFKWMSMSEGFDLFQWDCSRGLLETQTLQQVKSANNEVHELPGAVLGHIIEHAKNDNQKMSEEKLTGEGHIYMLLDFHPFLRDNPEIQRQLKEFFSISSVCCIVMISPVFECPETLDKEFTLIDFPYPSAHELRSALRIIKHEIPANYPQAVKFADAHEEDLLLAAAGLTINEAENAYALSLVKHKNFNIPTIIDEKKQIIKKTGIIEFREPRFSFDEVGGLDALKSWLHQRRLAFTEDALEFGLPAPKGALLVGIPGTGKSMTCDALANYWQMPLLRLDMGAVFSPHVGESEQNMRQVVQVSETIAPCILWVDEIEKGIGGVASSNQTDGGVGSRIFGTLLTWLQEKTSPVFVICTANNVHAIPPEFMRAGRFDEIFFLDLPNKEQREDVLIRLIAKKNRDPQLFDVSAIAAASENYSPAELEKAIGNALFIAYAEDKRPLTTEDIVSEVGKFQPLYNSRRDEIQDMKDWALGEDGSGGRAVLANSASSHDSGDYSVKTTSRNLSFSEEDV